MRRTDLMDVSPWMHRRMVELERERTPEQRFLMVCELSDMMLQIRRATRHLRPGEEEPCLKPRESWGPLPGS